MKIKLKNKGMECPEIGKAIPISQLAIPLNLKELRNAQVIREKNKGKNLWSFQGFQVTPLSMNGICGRSVVPIEVGQGLS